VVASLRFRSKSGVSLSGQLSMAGRLKLGVEWLLFKSGLGATNFFEVGAFFKSGSDVDYFNLQHEFLPFLADFQSGKVLISEGFQYFVSQMRPYSRGRIGLKSAKATDKPAIYLSRGSRNAVGTLLTKRNRLNLGQSRFESSNLRGQSESPPAGHQHNAHAAAEYLFQQPEFLAAGKNAASFGGIFGQAADDLEPPPAPDDLHLRRRKRPAIQPVRRPQKRQDQKHPIGVVTAAQNHILACFRDFTAVIECQVSQGPALAIFQGERFVLQKHLGADVRMVFFADMPADIVDQRGHAKQAAVSRLQIVKGKGRFNQATRDGADPTFVANGLQVVRDPTT